MLRFPIFVLLFVLSLLFACSYPSWFPIKQGPPHKAKKKELLHKEVIIIDREEYVKVSNPNASEDGGQPKYLYIPVDEYLSKREAFTNPVIPPKEEGKKEFTISSTSPSPSGAEKEISPASSSIFVLRDLKKKVVMTHFDDQTANADEVFGDWVSEKLTKELSRRSSQILFIDYLLVKEFLEGRQVALTDLENPKTLHLLNEVFGIHALMVGQLSGPYVFTTKSAKDQDATASAIIKIEMRMMDTLSGKTLKSLSVSNPILASKEKGTFPEERAKAKAIDLTLNDISKALSRELDNLNWFCRVVKVEGEEIYINAGKLTGLKVGDMMELFPTEELGGSTEIKGRIQISSFFGIDASMGRLIDGKKPDVDDILKLAKTEGI